MPVGVGSRDYYAAYEVWPRYGRDGVLILEMVLMRFVEQTLGTSRPKR